MKLNEIGFYISPFSILLPIAALISVRKSLNTRRFQITSIFFIICLISEIFQIAFASIYKNNLIVLNIFAGIEFIFWCYFFFELLNFIFLRVLIIVLFIPVCLIWLHHVLYDTLWNLNSLFATCEASVVLLLSAFYLLILSKNSFKPLQEVPEFWFASAVLIYFTNSIITLGASWFIRETKQSELISAFNDNFFMFYFIFNILANIIYSKGFLCLSTKKI